MTCWDQTEVGHLQLHPPPSPAVYFLSLLLVFSLHPIFSLRAPLPVMVSSAPRKRKRGHAQTRTGIPLHRDAVVTRVEITRKTKQRILTKSFKVSVPVIEATSSQRPPSRTPEPQPLVSDSEPPIDKPQKGPSRSVAVTPFGLFHLL